MAVDPTERSGWFWDLVEGRGAAPPAPTLLGFRLISVDPQAGVVEGTFTARPEFANMMGGVQGGFLAAMLDTTVSSALLALLPGGHFAPTLELSLKYLRPAPLGVIRGRGWVVHRGGTVAFLAGELYDPDGLVVTTATATARIVRPRD